MLLVPICMKTFLILLKTAKTYFGPKQTCDMALFKLMLLRSKKLKALYANNYNINGEWVEKKKALYPYPLVDVGTKPLLIQLFIIFLLTLTAYMVLHMDTIADEALSFFTCLALLMGVSLTQLILLYWGICFDCGFYKFTIGTVMLTALTITTIIIMSLLVRDLDRDLYNIPHGIKITYIRFLRFIGTHFGNLIVTLGVYALTVITIWVVTVLTGIFTFPIAHLIGINYVKVVDGLVLFNPNTRWDYAWLKLQYMQSNPILKPHFFLRIISTSLYKNLYANIAFVLLTYTTYGVCLIITEPLRRHSTWWNRR